MDRLWWCYLTLFIVCFHCVMQDAHMGTMTAETEKDTKEKTRSDRYPDSVQQQKSHNPRTLADSPRKKPEQDSKPRVKPSGWTCGECLRRFADRESYISHMKTSHGKVRVHE